VFKLETLGHYRSFVYLFDLYLDLDSNFSIVGVAVFLSAVIGPSSKITLGTFYLLLIFGA